MSGASAALEQAVATPHIYPRWVATFGWAALALTVALQLGVPVAIAVPAFCVTGLIDRLGRLLSGAGISSFFLQAVRGFVTTSDTVVSWSPAMCG